MRKVLSFVLVLTLVLSSFSMAFAADTTATNAGLSDIAGNANKDAIQVAYDLGIVTGNPDGTFLPSKAVTRAEFAAMITRALAVPESALAGYTATTFKDTAGYGWAVPYLAFAQSKGIMLGDGAGNVMPGRTINTNEAMTMVLRAIGYTSNSAELVGSWPANYVTLAQNKDLYTDVANVLNVDKANAAQVIYNALTVQKVAVNSDGETKALTIGSTTEAAVLLNTGLGCTTDSNKVLGSAGYSYDDAIFDITPNLGAHGDAYIKDGDVVAFAVKDSVALTGKISDGKFKVGDVKYNFPAGWVLNTSTVAIGIENGVDNGSVTPGSIAHDGDNITINADVSGKTMSTIYSIVGWHATDAAKVDAADLKALDDAQLLTGDFDTNDDDSINAKSFELVGAKSLDDIKADDVVYIYADGTSDNYIRKVAVANNVVTGKVTEVGSDFATVNGVEYSFYGTAAADSVTTGNLPSAGDEVTLTLDPNGYVYDIEATGTADTFAVVKAFDSNSGSTLLPPQAKLYSSDDSSKTYDLAEGSDMTVASGSTGMNATSLTIGAIVGYGLDKDGVIDNLNLTVVSTSAIARLDSASIVSVGATTVKVASDVVVFTKVAGAATYDVTTIDNVETGQTLNVDGTFQYIVDTDSNKIVAMLITNTQAGKSSDDIYAVVNNVTDTVNADDDAVLRIQGVVGSDTLDKKTTFSTFASYSATTAQAFSFKLDADGNIKSINTPVAEVGGTTTTVGGIDSTSIKLGTKWYSLADNVVVYQAKLLSDGTVDEYVKSSVSSIRSASNYYAKIYDMDNGSDAGGYEVVVWWKY